MCFKTIQIQGVKMKTIHIQNDELDRSVLNFNEIFQNRRFLNHNDGQLNPAPSRCNNESAPRTDIGV